MGMFDIIICEYPLETRDELKEWDIDLKNIQFQTKDLDNVMCTYTIRENGELWKKHEEYKWVDDDRSPLKGYLDVVSSEDKHHPYHGVLEFYCYENLGQKDGKHYVLNSDYLAKFNDGKIVEIKSTKFDIEDVTEHKKKMDAFFEEDKKRRNKFYNKYIFYSKPFISIRRKIIRLAYNWYKMNGYIYNCIVRWL